MKISVILCTYNRCQTLARALESLAGQELPESMEWEVLVVDNNSKDKTREVVEGFCRRYSNRFRYVFESRQGLSHARNAGIREALGDVLAFTDDDVTLDPTWLRNLAANFEDSQWAGCGGRILPERTFSAPGWLSVDNRHSLAPLTIFDGGPNSYELSEPAYGANMAFRKEMFEKYGAFRTDLGRCAENLLSNEDTEYGYRLLNAGERLRYEASAVVYHPVTEDRLQKKYFLAWWIGKGRTNIRQWGYPPDIKWRVAGVPLVLFRSLTACTMRWMFSFKPARRFYWKILVWEKIGEMMECRRISRDPSLKHSPEERFSTTL